jgi:hypothetical protein
MSVSGRAGLLGSKDAGDVEVGGMSGGEKGEAVGGRDRYWNHQDEGRDGDRRRERERDSVGDRPPAESPRDNADWHTDEESERCYGGALRTDHRAGSSAGHAECSEYSDIAGPQTDRCEQCVPDRRDAKKREETGECSWQGSNVVEVCQLDRYRYRFDRLCTGTGDLGQLLHVFFVVSWDEPHGDRLNEVRSFVGVGTAEGVKLR